MSKENIEAAITSANKRAKRAPHVLGHTLTGPSTWDLEHAAIDEFLDRRDALQLEELYERKTS